MPGNLIMVGISQISNNNNLYFKQQAVSENLYITNSKLVLKTSFYIAPTNVHKNAMKMFNNNIICYTIKSFFFFY